MDDKRLKALCVSSRISIKQAMKTLHKTGERILLVVKGRKLVGTLSDGDVRQALINGAPLGALVEKFMEQNFISLPMNQPQLKIHAQRQMMERKIGQIPILDGHGNLVDLVLWTDVLGDQKKVVRKAQTNPVVIMAGGKGTRLDPFTRVLPKPLIPIGEKPVIEVIMEKFYDQGFSKFFITLNYKKEYVLLYLKENKFPYKVEPVVENEFMGTIGSLQLLKGKLNESFFVINCDSLLSIDFEEVVRWHEKSQAALTIVGCYNEFRIPFGVLELSHGRLKEMKEKPIHEVMINTGAYILDPRILSYIKEGKPMDMTQLIDEIKKKEKVSVYPINEGWVDVGQWEEYKKALGQIGG